MPRWFPVLLFYISCSASLQGQQPDKLLLKDFRPRSIYRIPVTPERRYKLPVIDMHSHPYATTPEELKQWVSTLHALGITKTIILTAATGSRFDSLYHVYAAYGELFEVWCGFDYTGWGTTAWPASGIKELERCYKTGARGVGELGDKGYGEVYSHPVAGKGIHMDDPQMKPLFQKCAALGMPVSIHVAEPQWMYEPMDASNDGLMNAYTWRIDSLGAGFRGHKALISSLEHAVRENPRTTFIACHFANCEADLAILSSLLRKYSNLYADVAARYGETSPIPRYMKKFYTEHAKQLLYGTDMGMEAAMYEATFRILETADEHFYETELFSYHWACHGFDLPVKALKLLYFKNARRILKR